MPPVDSILVSESPEITPEAVEAAVADALTAIAAAADTAELKAARAAHVADGSPLAVLNASMRQVAPENKAAFGKLVGQGRGQVTQALAAKEAELAEAEVAARLEAERVDITLANLSILKTGKAKAMRFSTLEAICEVLECQPGDLLGYQAD